MNLEIFTNPTDDPRFLELAKHLIVQLVTQSLPDKIFVIKVDNWFDHKWLRFSGIGSVGFFWGMNAPDTALDEFSQDKITFPPFNPKRVVGEWYFLRDASGEYLPSFGAPYVHQRKLAPSAENLHKRVTDFAESAIFIWLSSNTKSNRRGSMMVYEVAGSEVHTWYAGFAKKENWGILHTKGISREEVMLLIQPHVMQGRT
jgi:hypothetical protein